MTYDTSWKPQYGHFGISFSSHAEETYRAFARPVHVWCTYTVEGHMIVFLFALQVESGFLRVIQCCAKGRVAHQSFALNMSFMAL